MSNRIDEREHSRLTASPPKGIDLEPASSPLLDSIEEVASTRKNFIPLQKALSCLTSRVSPDLRSAPYKVKACKQGGKNKWLRDEPQTEGHEFETVAGPYFPSADDLGVPAVCGRLGQSIEGGGKRRIFAIGNWVNQRLLKPVHDWLMSVLRHIPMDGTFSQTRPLSLLSGEKHCFSFDLKSATDRWPLLSMFYLMQVCFGRQFASAVVNSALGTNVFEVYPLRTFDRYAVLGDDVVIADKKVAKVYEHALSELGVQISYQKSLISDNGCAEFAKRFFARGLTKDFSPVSIKSLLNPFHPYGLMSIHMTYPIKRFSTLCRIGGFGYRTISSLPHRQSPRIRRLLAMFTKRSMPFELWLGRGRPLNPYLKGSLVEWLRRETAPKDLHLFPDEARLGNVGDFWEWSVLRAWVKQWLTYCRWYYLTAWSPEEETIPSEELYWKAEACEIALCTVCKPFTPGLAILRLRSTFRQIVVASLLDPIFVRIDSAQVWKTGAKLAAKRVALIRGTSCSGGGQTKMPRKATRSMAYLLDEGEDPNVNLPESVFESGRIVNLVFDAIEALLLTPKAPLPSGRDLLEPLPSGLHVAALVPLASLEI
ncbi:hypothetical protein ZIOFF_074354 (mitochondrion) [Zingiber officinale]|uniref:RNA-dependent RNA polymerase n=1 Tax=Zingiber officinale TaxID=94328 RepID=A0A8J5ENI5_ZINOF|nr:hypothetical protein ZIOFF_074354 [Zingiber officinale]